MLGNNPKKVADCYGAIAKMIDAGVPLDRTLESLGSALDQAERDILNRLIRRIRSGSFLAGSMKVEGLPPLDVALIKIGEESGSLVESARSLSKFYENRWAIERSVRGALIKPFFLFIMSLFLRDLPLVLSQTMTIRSYLLKTCGTLGLVIGFIAGFFYFYRASGRSRSVAEAWHKLFGLLPWFGEMVRKVAKERLFTCLALGLKSGCDMNSMIEIAKQMTFLPSTRDAAEKIADRSQKIGFAQSIAEAGICSSSEILTLKTGEVSGNLDSSFGKIAEDLRIDIDRDFRLIEEWLPKLVYVLALLYVVSGLFSSLSNQMNSLNQMIEKI